MHKGLNKGTIGLECLLGTRRAHRGGSSTFSYNSLKRWGSVRIRYVSVQGDIGMANYEKRMEQEAAYPIPISLYNCYMTVRHEKRGIAIYS